MTRREGETITIGDARVEIRQTRHRDVTVHIVAPRSVKVGWEGPKPDRAEAGATNERGAS